MSGPGVVARNRRSPAPTNGFVLVRAPVNQYETYIAGIDVPTA